MRPWATPAVRTLLALGQSLRFVVGSPLRFATAAALLATPVLIAGALGYLTAGGTGSATASVGGLPAPANVAATTSGTSAAVTWSAVSPPASGSVTYNVTRNRTSPGGTAGGAVCSGISGTSCSDTNGGAGLASGDYTYTVTALWRSWSNGATSNQVATLDRFTVTPTGVGETAGIAFSVTVTAIDHDGATMTAYAGTAHFSSSDGSAVLPPNYQFTTGAGNDNGAHTFTNGVTLRSAGSGMPVSVNDTVVSGLAGTASYTVAKASPGLSLAGAGSPGSGTAGVAVAASAVTATVASLSGSNAGGTITFTYFQQASAPSTCSSGGTTIGTASVSGNGAYNPSVGFTPSVAGNYWLYASYAGDANNNSAASACPPGVGLEIVVAKASPTLSLAAPASGTAGSAVAASAITATLASSSGADAGGTITFTYFLQASAPLTCSSGGTTIGTATVSGNGAYNPNVGFTPTVAGNYWLYASYPGDGNNNAAASACPPGAAQKIVVAKASPTLSLAAPASGSAGSAVAASAITGTVASSSGANATGTITFTYFQQASAPLTCTSGGTTIGSASAAGNGTYSPNVGFTPTVAGNYWLYASYPGDGNNNSAASACPPGSAQEISVAKASPTLTVSTPATGYTRVTLASSAITATLAASSGSNNANTITFTVFGPQASAPSTCTSGGTTVGTATPAGNGTYSSSASFTPTSTGNYWWYVSSSSDANNNAAASTCGSGMTETVVGEGGPDINAVDVVSATAWIAVGQNCSIFFGTNAGSWTELAKPSGCTANLTGVDAASATAGWIVGSSNTILTCSSNCQTSTGTWSTVTAAHFTSTTNITGVSDNQAGTPLPILVGNDGTSAYIGDCSANCTSTSSSTWNTRVTLTSTTLKGVNGHAAGLAAAVGVSGSNGVMEICTSACASAGASWSAVTSTTVSSNGQLNGVFFEAVAAAVAVGNGGVVEVCSASCNTTGATWSTVTNSGLSTANLNSVAALTGNGGNGGKNDIYTVGDGGEIGYCLAGGGTTCVTAGSGSWHVETSHTSNNLAGVSFSANAASLNAAQTVVTVGANGTISTATAANSWLSPVATLSTNTAAHNAATTVTVSGGSGFTATNGSAVKVVFNGTSQTTTPSSVTTSGGGFSNSNSFTFQTPTTLAAGTYELVITDSVGDAIVFSFTLT
jgi:hypothetical protein